MISSVHGSTLRQAQGSPRTEGMLQYLILPFALPGKCSLPSGYNRKEERQVPAINLSVEQRAAQRCAAPGLVHLRADPYPRESA
ncbi:MAG: hypothetical protein FD168_12 [Desulfobulbaceae bacterium]|nr:MAG: hypothetical protein FD168_12 [Desulfobulbaceae bacterium]